MNKNVYGSLALVGGIISLLEFVLADNDQLAYTVLFMTFFVICGLYLFEEWRFYHQHQAMIASFQFLALPIFLLLVGNILAPLSLGGTILAFHMDFLRIEVEARSTMTSLSLMLPFIMVLGLTSRYYDGRYPGFVVRRKTYGNLYFPFFIHLSSLVLLLAEGSLTGYLDFMIFLFVIASTIQIFVKLVYPHLPSLRRHPPSSSTSHRRGFLNSFLGGERGRSRRTTRSTRSTRPSRRSDQSRNTRSVSTTPADGYREIPVRSRNSSPRHRTAASISQGVEGFTPLKPASKVSSKRLKKFLPKGKFSSDDLKCMVCYEEFNGKHKNNILICPHCRFPAHETELISWLKQSNICPRCSRAIPQNYLNSASKISEKQYSSLIRRL